MKFLQTVPARGARAFIEGFNRHYISTFATNGAFYMFLSLFPLVVLFGSILPLTGLTSETALGFLDAIMPTAVMTLLEGIVKDVYGSNVAVLSLSAVATLWSAGQALAAVIKGIDVITGDIAHDFYLKRRLRAMGYTLGLLITVAVSLLVMVFGNRVADAVLVGFPLLENTLDRLLRGRYLGSFLLLTTVFALLYRSVPSKPGPLRRQLPGALFAAVSWMLCSWLFSLYVGWSGSFSAYGSMATVVIAMMWMYYNVYLILIGAWLNTFLRQLKSGHILLPPGYDPIGWSREAWRKLRKKAGAASDKRRP